MQQEEVNIPQNSNKSNQSQIQNPLQNQQHVQGRWNDDQHNRFLQGLFKYGKNWKQIQLIVQTRICSQVRSHAQKYFIKLNKIIKDRKKIKYKSMPLTPIQIQILSKFNKYHITNQTPQILINLINNTPSQSKLKQLQNQSILTKNHYNQQLYHNHNIANKKQSFIQSHPSFQSSSSLYQQSHSQSSHHQPNKNQNIINFYYNQQHNQDKSFFLRLIQHNVQHFRKGRDFIDFIDFQRKHSQQFQLQQQLDSATTLRNRRSSFTLVDDLQNDQKLKQALEKLKTG